AKAWAGVAALAGLRPDAKFVMSPKGDLYEDVVVENPAQERSEVLEIPASTIATIHKDLEPLLTVGAFLTRRVDCLINLRAFARREWPGQNRVGLMDLFAKAQPLYRQFLAAESEAIKKGEWASTFNPSDLDELRLAAERRGEIAAVLDSCLVPSETGAEIDRAKMRRLADRVPAAYRPSVGGCLFLQPAKADGSLWVLNRMYEGTGRYSSRYTAVMGDDQRSAFAERLRAGSTFEVDGRPAELVDLLCAQGDTLNVHALQTERVIEFPGEDSGAPRHRRLALQDLSVEISQDDDGVPLRLLDADGRWILPAHLGGTILRFMPIMVKFLALFGPGDLRRANPMPALREENGVPVRDRVTLGKVVLLRKQWRTKPADLVAEVARKSEAEAFERVHRWRNERGVPERVFMVEKRPSRLNLELYKPQYVDFRSPSLVKIFLAAAATTPELLVLMEALPTTEEFPETSDGQRRLVEVQCESISAQGAPSSVPPAGGAETPVPLTGAVTNRG
ncbi:MAG: lantibiotic dehydratase, partial [Acidobacteriota bacterium]